MKDINATVIVDLKPEVEKIRARLHKDARWGIGRAERDGLIVEKTNRKEDWQEFYGIYKDTMKEGGATPTPIEKLKQNTYVFFVCKKNNKIVAGAGIWFIDIYNSAIPRLYFNASLKEYQKSQPNNLLYWKCILWAKNNGYDKFDLGGWQIKAKGHLQGVNKFKEKWGKVVFYKKDYPLHVAVGRKLVRNFKFFKKLSQKLKRKR